MKNKKTVIIEMLAKTVPLEPADAVEAWESSEIVLDESNFIGEHYLTEENYKKLLEILAELGIDKF